MEKESQNISNNTETIETVNISENSTESTKIYICEYDNWYSE